MRVASERDYPTLKTGRLRGADFGKKSPATLADGCFGFEGMESAVCFGWEETPYLCDGIRAIMNIENAGYDDQWIYYKYGLNWYGGINLQDEKGDK